MSAAVECPETACGDDVDSDSPRTALIVDNSTEDRGLVSRLVERMTDLQASCAANAKEALALINREPPTIVLMEVRLPGMEELEARQNAEGESSVDPGHLDDG